MDAPFGSPWHTDQELTDGAVILHVRGEIDLATAQKFAQALSGLSGDRAAVIDLAHVEYLDLIGVRALEEFDAQRRTAGRRVILAAPQLHVRRVLEFTGAAHRFRIVETVAEALNLLQIAPSGEGD